MWMWQGNIRKIRALIPLCRAVGRVKKRIVCRWGNADFSKTKGDDKMKITITGRNIELTDGLKAAVEERLSKLDKFFSRETVANVTLSVEKDRQKVEVTIPVKGHIIRSEQVSSDMYVSIELVEEVIERQLKKYRHKLVDKKQSGAADFSEAFAGHESDEEEEIRIIRSKRFGVKPMYPEDACVEMELLGHSFFVFRNAESDEVNVVYKRKDGTYGMIEPDF